MLKLRKTPNGFEVRVAGGDSFSLPSAAELKAKTIDVAVDFGGEDSDAVRMLNDCDFDFEIVPGKDAIEQLIGIVITASPENAAVLREGKQPVVSEIMGALMEVCPDIGSDRIVARGERSKPIRKRKTAASSQRADKSPEMDKFVRDLTTMFVNQGRDATAFGEAARWGHLPLVNEMLATGINVDARTETDCTPLMLAASAGHIDIVRALIAAGADVNAVDRDKGMTPLMWNLAAMHTEATYVAAIHELLNAGADRTITAKDGRTALDWARERHSPKLAAMLAES